MAVNLLPGIVAGNSVMGQNNVGYCKVAKSASYNAWGTLVILRRKPVAIT